MNSDPSPASPATGDAGEPRLVVQLGHSGPVTCVALSADGDWLATGSSDRTVRVWQVATGRELRVFDDVDKVKSVALSADGSVLATVDRTVRMWDVATGGSLAGPFRVPGVDLASVALSADGRSMAATGQPRRFKDELTSHDPDPKADFQAWLWPVGSSREEPRRFEDPEARARIRSVALSADGAWLAAGSADETVLLWRVENGEARRFEGRRGLVLALGHGGFEAGPDGPTGLWQFEDDEAGRIVGHDGEADLVALSAHGAFRLTADGPAVRLGATSFAGVAGPIRSVAFTAGGEWLEAERWEEPGRSRASARPASSDRIALTDSAAVSSDGKRLVEVGEGTLVVRDLETGRQVFEAQLPVLSANLSPDGSLLATALDPESVAAEEHTSYAVAWKLEESGPGREVGLFRTRKGVRLVAFSSDRRWLAAAGAGTVRLWRAPASRPQGSVTPAGHPAESVGVDPIGLFEALEGGPAELGASAELARSDLLDAESIDDSGEHGGDFEPRLEPRRHPGAGAQPVADRERLGGITAIAFSPDGHWLAVGRTNGSALLLEIPGLRPAARVVPGRDDRWTVIDPRGRFDTSDLEEAGGLHWVMPDDPMHPLPLEVFMRDFYEPGLLAKILTGTPRASITKGLSQLNRVQPEVAIAGIESLAGGPNQVRVTVEVASRRRTFERPGGAVTQDSGAMDLRLFRDGQLVGFIDGDLEAEKAWPSFVFDEVRLPLREGITECELSAYAFNLERVKSETARKTHPLPADLLRRPGRAYVLAIGVDVYDRPELELGFAARDASAILRAVPHRLRTATGGYDEVVAIELRSDRKHRRATKDEIRRKLAELAARVRPDDLVLITFSGHGYDREDGTFYLLPSDVGTDGAVKDHLDRAISSDELSLWLRGVDAGDIALVIDACHSASSVQDPGWKPGPFGSRGLGQLAYDKGILVLAASQADGVAREHPRLGHGLLTYALVVDGLEQRRADFKPADEEILLSEWLAYGARRVPALHRELQEDRIARTGGKRFLELGLPEQEEVAVQSPVLFDFRKREDTVVLAGSEATR